MDMTTLSRCLAALLLPLALLAASPATASPATATAPVRADSVTCHRTLKHYPILHAGDRRPAVRTLQCSLNDLGLGPVSVDGYYGPETKRAFYKIVSHFEGGLPPHPYRINNGIWTLLFAGQLPQRTLSEGEHGHAVVVLQRALRAAGGELDVDGDFGPQTAAVVAQYQKANHIKVSGTVDDDTRFYLAMGGVIGQQS
jgi:peptidoglycan hydrolase-like protein with peptidoglycan-binding domain